MRRGRWFRDDPGPKRILIAPSIRRFGTAASFGMGCESVYRGRQGVAAVSRRPLADVAAPLRCHSAGGICRRPSPGGEVTTGEPEPSTRDSLVFCRCRLLLGHLRLAVRHLL